MKKEKERRFQKMSEKRELSIQTAVVTEKKELAPVEKTQNSVQVSNWLIALGVGVTVAAATTATIYYVKSKRKKELKDLRYQEPTVQSYSQKIGKYWTLATETFGAVRSIIGDFLSPKHKPFVTENAKSTSPSLLSHNDEEEIVLGEAEL